MCGNCCYDPAKRTGTHTSTEHRIIIPREVRARPPFRSLIIFSLVFVNRHTIEQIILISGKKGIWGDLGTPHTSRLCGNAMAVVMLLERRIA